MPPAAKPSTARPRTAKAPITKAAVVKRRSAKPSRAKAPGIAELKVKIGDKKVICALSGGVDSTVAAVMLHRAIGTNLTCVFIDNGLLRKNEGDAVEEMCLSKFKMNFISCLLYTSPSPRDGLLSRMPSSA